MVCILDQTNIISLQIELRVMKGNLSTLEFNPGH